MPEDAKEAIGHGIRAKRSKSGAISFDLLGGQPCTGPRAGQGAGGAHQSGKITCCDHPVPLPAGERPDLRYALLSSGLEIVRKSLGRHEIATVQTTEIDKDAGLVRLTTVLVHSSGQWLSSEWPVCAISETGSQTTHGRRADLCPTVCPFHASGNCGEDDLDAPISAPTPARSRAAASIRSPRPIERRTLLAAERPSRDGRKAVRGFRKICSRAR